MVILKDFYLLVNNIVISSGNFGGYGWVAKLELGRASGSSLYQAVACESSGFVGEANHGCGSGTEGLGVGPGAVAATAQWDQP